MKTMSLRAGIAAVAATVFAAATIALAPPSGAIPASINYGPVASAVFQPGSLKMAGTLTGTCDATITSGQVTFTVGGVPTTAVTASDFTTNGFVATVPQGLAVGGNVTNTVVASVTCSVSSSPLTFTNSFTWAQIDVTKAVEGDAPAGATFPISIDCGAVAGSVPGSVGPATLPPATSFSGSVGAGQTFSLFAVTNGECTVTETDTLGALSSVVSPTTVTIANSYLYPVTITNTFAAKPRFAG